MKNFFKISLLLLFCSAPFCAFADATDISKGGNSAIKVDLGTTKISDQKYSVQQDDSGLCKYVNVTNGGVTEKALQINSGVFNTDNVLMGLADPAKCPLPGTDFLPEGYPDALSGEFILSGVICVVQSIILDSMFRVYCTILLWFYQILFAMMVVYIMFYGLAIIFGLTDNPISEAPKRIFFIIFIFFMAVNAEVTFKWIFQTFNIFLDTFSNILTRIQPLYDEDGRRVYDEEGHLLAENGEIWQPLATGTEYILALPYTDEDTGLVNPNETTNTVGNGPTTVPTSMPIKNGTYAFVPITDPLKYSPFRVPAQQWQSKIEGTGANKQFKVYPVFRQFNSGLNGEVMFVDDTTFCTVDFIYNHQKRRLELSPRCHQKDWTTIPEFAPYGAQINKNLSPQGEESQYTGFGAYDAAVLRPQKLLDEPANLSTPCDEANDPEKCRQPFQGILGKVDALFDSVLGDDNAKSLASLAIALALWGVGGGAVLSLFLMTGVLTMFTAFVQIIWVYVTALMGFVFLMMLAPMFISFKLFKITEPMFKAWVSMIVSFMWQPVIVLGFVYVLSNATTLDKLSMLAKNELGEKRYETSGEGGVKGEFQAPGFLEPAYRMPPDYSSVREVGADELAMVDNKEDTLLSRTQREEYRARKSAFLLTQYLFTLGAVSMDDVSKPNEVSSVNGSQKAKDFLTVYNNETTFTFPPVAPVTEPTKIIMKGADTINEYAQSDTLPTNTQLTNADMDGFITLYNAQLGVEDRDAFRGEPAAPIAIDPTNRPVGEFPVCVKNCPSFDPPYDINDQTKVSPKKEECVAFCLYVQGNDREMFAYMAGAMIIWVVLNAMTGAFMAKVPKLAEALSKLYSLNSGVALFGASKSDSQPLLWASTAQSDFYNPGGLLDTGLTTGRPGVIARTVDRVQQLAGRHEVADGQGGLTKVDGESLYAWGGIFGMKSPEQKRNEENATKARQVYFDLLKNDAIKFNELKTYIDKYNPGGKNQQAIEDDIRKFIQSKPGVNDVGSLKREYLLKLQNDKIRADKKAQEGKTGFVPSQNQTTEGAWTAAPSNRESISSRTSEPDSRRYISADQIPYGDTASLYDDRPANPYKQGPVNASVLDAGGVEYQRGGSVNAGQSTGAATATVLSAAGITATGKNIMGLAKYFDPKSGKLNEKYREQFEAVLKNIAPNVPAGEIIDKIEGLSSRIIITNDNDTRVASSPEKKPEEVTVEEMMPVGERVQIVQPVPVAPIPIKPLAALTGKNTGILSQFGSDKTDDNAVGAPTIPDKNEVPEVVSRTAVPTDYKAPEESYSLSRAETADYSDRINKIRNKLKNVPYDRINQFIEQNPGLSDEQIIALLGGEDLDGDLDQSVSLQSDISPKSAGFKDVDEMVPVSSLMSSSENPPEREVVIAQPVQVSNIKSSIYASSNDQAEEIITDNSQRISEYVMKKQEEVPEAGISRTDVVPERIYSEAPVADSRSEVSFAGTEQSQVYTIDKQANEQPQNFVGEAAPDNQPSVSAPVVQNAQNSVQPIEYTSPFADLLKKEEESTPYQFSGKNDVGDNSSGSGISGMARETPSILPTSEGTTPIVDIDAGINIAPETPKIETPSYAVEPIREQETESVYENTVLNIGELENEAGLKQARGDDPVIDSSDRVAEVPEPKEEFSKVQETAYDAVMMVDEIPSGVFTPQIAALAEVYALHTSKEAEVIAANMDGDLKRVVSGEIDMETLINEKKEFFMSGGANAETAGTQDEEGSNNIYGKYGKVVDLAEGNVVTAEDFLKRDKKGSDKSSDKIKEKSGKGKKDKDDVG